MENEVDKVLPNTKSMQNGLQRDMIELEVGSEPDSTENVENNDLIHRSRTPSPIKKYSTNVGLCTAY